MSATDTFLAAALTAGLFFLARSHGRAVEREREQHKEEERRRGRRRELCKALPKIELHAHLNGSIRKETLRELLLARPSAIRDKHLPNSGGGRDLASCFRMFAAIHAAVCDSVGCGMDGVGVCVWGGGGGRQSESERRELTPLPSLFLAHRTQASVTRIARETVLDMARDGVVYLELRSTPRPDLELTDAEGGSDETSPLFRRIASSHRIVASHRITSHRIASHRIASHRTAPHRTASHCIASNCTDQSNSRPGGVRVARRPLLRHTLCGALCPRRRP